MKGDKTLPDKYEKTVKIEFPRVGSNDVEEYDIRPYDFASFSMHRIQRERS